MDKSKSVLLLMATFAEMDTLFYLQTNEKTVDYGAKNPEF